MKKPAMAIGRLAALLLVTLVAGAVMLATGTKSSNRGTGQTHNTDTAQTMTVAAPVVVQEVELQPVEIVDIYSGMIRPFERYSVAFEIGGRIKQLGQSADGLDLDDGDPVRQGQVLALLDQRILQARVKETAAVLEQTQEEMERAKQLRNRPTRVIAETEFQRRVTELAVAEAQLAMADKNLEDATLLSPCDGRIAKRLVNPGESVTMHSPVFEIVQVDRVLLVVGVVESRVREIEARRLKLGLEEHQAADGTQRPFKAYVQLLGSDRFGTAWPVREAEVYRIGETADDKTGLFEVEILLDNSDASLRPGQIAMARIVTDDLSGFVIPVESALFRGDTPYVYAVQESSSDLNYLFWNLGPTTDFKALQIPLTRFIEQEGSLIVPALPANGRRIVVRGQHRLVNERRVRIVPSAAAAETARGRADLESSNSKTSEMPSDSLDNPG